MPLPRVFLRWNAWDDSAHFRIESLVANLQMIVRWVFLGSTNLQMIVRWAFLGVHLAAFHRCGLDTKVNGLGVGWNTVLKNPGQVQY